MKTILGALIFAVQLQWHALKPDSFPVAALLLCANA